MAKKQLEIPKVHLELVEPFLDQMWGGMENVYNKIRSEIGSDPAFEDFRKFCNDQMLGYFVAHTEADVQYYSNVLFHLFMMHEGNQKVYRVMPGLATKLMGTSLRHIDTDFIVSPFREIFFSVDPGLLRIEDVKQGTVDVSGIYLYCKRHPRLIEMRFMAAAILKPTPDIPFNDSVFYFKLFLKPGKIGEVVDEYIENQIKWNMVELERYNGSLNIKYMKQLVYFVINTLLYMTSKREDIVSQLPIDFAERRSQIKSKAKIRKLDRREEKATKIPIILVGPSVFQDEETTNRIKNSGGLIAWRLNKRIEVTSHWRGQWRGSEKQGNRQKFTILIDDYERGPKDASLEPRIRQIGRR